MKSEEVRGRSFGLLAGLITTGAGLVLIFNPNGSRLRPDGASHRHRHYGDGMDALDQITCLDLVARNPEPMRLWERSMCEEEIAQQRRVYFEDLIYWHPLARPAPLQGRLVQL